MNIEELKKQRFMRLWQAESRAPRISDVYKDVRIVKVSVELIFESGVLRDPNINKYALEITKQEIIAYSPSLATRWLEIHHLIQ